VTFWGDPPAETRDGPYKEITIVKARFLRFTGVPRETAKSELLDGLGRFGRSQARGAFGTVQTGKSEVSGIPRPGMPETEVWARVPKPGPRGPPRCPKGGVPKPPLLDPKPTIGRTAFWALSRNLGSGTGPRGSFQRRARVWRPQFWTP
jgi:hypothetical protein